MNSPEAARTRKPHAAAASAGPPITERMESISCCCWSHFEGLAGLSVPVVEGRRHQHQQCLARDHKPDQPSRRRSTGIGAVLPPLPRPARRTPRRLPSPALIPRSRPTTSGTGSIGFGRLRPPSGCCDFPAWRCARSAARCNSNHWRKAAAAPRTTYGTSSMRRCESGGGKGTSRRPTSR
jgi:hypothetical protein